MKYLFVLAAFAIGTGTAAAQHSGHAPRSAYAGEQGRQIKSLSAEDIDELRRGGGWGLAKAAELNGVPGPVHLLELRDQIPLTAAQVEALQALYADMREKAIAEGERLIALERELETAFREQAVSEDDLRRLLGEIARSHSSLRFIHLASHLRTPEILSQEQIARYNTLRGYDSDSCGNVPSGHDPRLWRKHNGCR